LEPGRHILVAPHVFQEAKDIGAPYIELGPIKRIIVNEGQVGISYDTGKLEVLLPGLHIRTSPTFRFQEFVSVQEQVRRLEPLKVNTNDGIAIMVNTIITYRIEDPVRAFRVHAHAFGRTRTTAHAHTRTLLISSIHAHF
jgi:uncharacterized membrane protein YqiK